MNLATSSPKTLPLVEFELLLSIRAASLAIEDVQTSGPAQKKIRDGFLWYDANYKRAKDAFGRLSVVYNHIEAEGGRRRRRHGGVLGPFCLHSFLCGRTCWEKRVETRCRWLVSMDLWTWASTDGDWFPKAN